MTHLSYDFAGVIDGKEGRTCEKTEPVWEAWWVSKKRQQDRKKRKKLNVHLNDCVFLMSFKRWLQHFINPGLYSYNMYGYEKWLCTLCYILLPMSNFSVVWIKAFNQMTKGPLSNNKYKCHEHFFAVSRENCYINLTAMFGSMRRYWSSLALSHCPEVHSCASSHTCWPKTFAKAQTPPTAPSKERKKERQLKSVHN